jgi:hypothetical protein
MKPGMRIRITVMRILIHLFTLMRFRILLLNPHQPDANLRRIVYRPSRAPFCAPNVSVHGPPRLHFKPLRLMNFAFNADPDPDPAFPSNADLDPASKINAEPDLQPCIGWMKPERKANIYR